MFRCASDHNKDLAHTHLFKGIHIVILKNPANNMLFTCDTSKTKRHKIWNKRMKKINGREILNQKKAWLRIPVFPRKIWEERSQGQRVCPVREGRSQWAVGPRWRGRRPQCAHADGAGGPSGRRKFTCPQRKQTAAPGLRCPPLSPGVRSNSHPLSGWWHQLPLVYSKN